MLIFLNTVHLDAAERAAVEEGAKRDGRTILWLYASGLAGESGLDPALILALTGFGVGMGDPLFGETAYPLMVETSLTGSRLAYGAGGRIGPVLYGADDGAEVLGWLIHPNLPGLLRRNFGTWTSVWSAVPNLPSSLIRVLARDAGVHVYGDAGDQVLVCGGVVAVHAAGDGEREIRFPEMCAVRDAVTGSVLGDGIDRIVLSMRKGDTALLDLRESGEQASTSRAGR